MVAQLTDAASPLDGAKAPALRVRGVVVGFGDVPVLRGVDFDLRPGQLVALMGENGAGKSTLVRCIAGDIAPAAGEVAIHGERVRSSLSAANSGLAVVWQDAALCDNLDVAANLFLGRERGRWFLSEPKANMAANALLASYGVKVAKVRAARALSTGQRQLVALVRAVQAKPRLLVLDEPTASLGVQETAQAEQLIRRVNSEGATVLLVSHDVEQVFRLAERVLVLHRGRVLADLARSETHPDEVVAIVAGHPPGTTARHQIARLQNLVDQLASAKLSSSLPLIGSALAAALNIETLCVHLAEDGALRLAAAVGLPPALSAAWAVLPVGRAGGPMGHAAEEGRAVVDEDVERSPSWAGFVHLARAAGVRSSWAVPLVGSAGLIGVITGCRPFLGPPQRDQMELVSLYASYAAGAVEREWLFGEVTARNRVLETIREVLETLAGPLPVSTGLLRALQALQLGLRAAEVELWERPPNGAPRCLAFVDADNQAHHEPANRDARDAAEALTAGPWQPARRMQRTGSTQLMVTTFDVPRGRAALIARWVMCEPPEDAVALMGDASYSLSLALERDEAEQAHQQAAALRRSHRLQQEFLSRLSHELRTPLTAIRGYASSLLASDVTWDEASKVRFLERIASESARLGRLVGDLLDFSAMEGGLLRLQPDWCDLGLVLEAAVSCLPPERSSSVEISCEPGLGPVWADHDRLEQVFVNLLENAFRHNPAGVSVKVGVTSGVPGRVVVRVADDGVGLPSEVRARLVEPASATLRGAGPAEGGLGLSIALGIVEAHGGRMCLGQASQGTTFLIELPVEAPEGKS